MLKNLYKLKVKDNLSICFAMDYHYLLKDSITYLYENKQGRIKIVSILGEDIHIKRENFKNEFLNEDGKLREVFEIIDIKVLEAKELYSFIKAFKNELFTNKKASKRLIYNLESYIDVTQHHWGGIGLYNSAKF